MTNSINPYIGPRAFEQNETIYGRDYEIRALLSTLIAERIVLLQAPSGAGKTSLIQAGIIPSLREENFDVLPIVRVNLEPPGDIHLGEHFNRYIYSTLVSLDEGLPTEKRLSPEMLANLTLDEYLSQRPVLTDGAISSVLVFDQFEEILTVAPSDRSGKEQFFAQLGSALRNDSRWALFAMRDDYLGAMQPYQRPIPNRLDVVFRLERLGPEAARQAIQKPAGSQGVEFTNAAAQKLVDDLRTTQVQLLDGSLETQLGQYVEPVQLQVVCYRLWQTRPPEQDSITESELATVGNVNQSLSDYYAACVEEVAESSGVGERQIRDWFDQNLITNEGLRNQVLMRQSSSEGLDNKVIRMLENDHLVHAEKRGGATWFELSHDRLVAPVRSSNTEWAAKNLSLLQRQATVWDQGGRGEGLLLRGVEFQTAEKESQSMALTQDELTFLSACRELRAREQRDRRRNTAMTILAIGAMIALVVAGVFYFQAQGSSAQNAKLAQDSATAAAAADASNLQAQVQTVKAGLLLNDAVNAKATAVASGEEAKRQAQIAFARQLMSPIDSINRSHNSRQNVAVLLAIQSMKVSPVEDAASFLLNNNLAARKIALMTHSYTVKSVAFSPDGNYVVSGSLDGTARVWEAATGKQVASMTHNGDVLSVAFSPDGKFVASGSADGIVILWEAGTGRKIVSMNHVGTVTQVAFSPDGRQVVSAGGINVCIWDASTGQELKRMEHYGVISVAYSPNGRYVVSGGAGQTIRIWEAATGKPFFAWTRRDGEVGNVAFSPNGKYVVSAGGRTVNIWDINTQKQLTPLNLGDTLEAIAFSHDSKYVVSGSRDNTARVWDISSGKEIALMTHDSWVVTVAFSPDDKYVVSGSRDNTARVWEAATGREVARMTHDGTVETAAFSPDGRYVASGSDDNTIRVWEAAPGMEVVNTIQGGRVSSVTFSPDAKYVLTVHSDGTASVLEVASGHEYSPNVKIESGVFSLDSKYVVSMWDYTATVWEVATGSEVTHMTTNGNLLSAAFSPDGKTVLLVSSVGVASVCDGATGKEIARKVQITSGSFSSDGKYVISSGYLDNSAHVWEPVTGKEVSRMTHKDNVIYSGFIPNTNNAVSISRDGDARVWDAATGKIISQNTNVGDVAYVGFSPDGHDVVKGSQDGAFLVWDATSGASLTWQDPAANVPNSKQGFLVFSPDSKYVASRKDDKTVCAWEFVTRKQVNCMIHDLDVKTAAFSPDGQYVASADKVARVWEVATGKEVAHMNHDDYVTSVAFSSDGKYVVSSSADNSVHVWAWQPEDLIDRACAVMFHNLSFAEWQQFIGEVIPYDKVCPNLLEP